MAHKYKGVNAVKIGNKVYNLRVADSFMSRFLGLMGKKSIPQNETLLITKCNAIHTFFMRFTMTAIFVDKGLRVTKVKKNIKPWQLCFAFGSEDVFEIISEGNDDLDVPVGWYIETFF